MIDLRVASINGQPITETHDPPPVVPGDVFGIKLYAVVSGANNLNDEAFQAIHGVVRSGTGGLLGNLSSALVAPFDGLASQVGSQTDVDGDGDLDIGGPVNEQLGSMFFIPRATSRQQDGDVIAGASPAAEQFLLAQLTFTTGATGGSTFITFIRRANPNGTPGAAFTTWTEDGVGKSGLDPYTVGSVHFIPEPGSLHRCLRAALRLRASLRRRQRRATTTDWERELMKIQNQRHRPSPRVPAGSQRPLAIAAGAAIFTAATRPPPMRD
jgi:hypothetical protein